MANVIENGVQITAGQKVVLSGELVRKPYFGTKKPDEILVAAFPLRTDEGDITITVKTFRYRADLVKRADLGKGDRVKIVGYVHQEKRPHRELDRTPVTVVYAAAIHRPNSQNEFVSLGRS
ncbi:hypothetical protein HY439_00465 [Candidatus Microgenomates bacterium]|nr:hypothetical protein [Candidatus Microgenomates bacterium]